MSGTTLIVGLGNPGPEYARTRHNVGFGVVDLLCERLGTRLRPAKGVRALSAEARAEDRRLMIAQPTTYMNESGEAVGALVRSAKVAAEDVIVVHDEIDLPLGTLRIKQGGGHGGHNGIRSVARAIGSEFVRVRIGVGRPAGAKDAADHVLDRFSKREAEEAEVVVRDAVDAVLLVIRAGVAAAQNQVHGGVPQETKKRRIKKVAVIDAPIAEVWSAWTTVEGAVTFFAPEASIVLEEGGAYELSFDVDRPLGSRGSEGCRVISLVPERTLSFTWNAPPHLPAVREEHTRVDVAMKSAGKERTRLTLTHSGFGDGVEWDEAFAYFERAWDVVLERLRSRFVEGPIDWSKL